MEDIELTEDELSRVNNIITGIQSDLDTAILHLKNNDFDKAITAINSGISKSNCPLCKRELGTLKADIIHNREICILKSETCQDEHTIIIKKAYELKDDFVPVKTKKKAIKDKSELLKENKKRVLLNLPLLPPIKELLTSPHLTYILKNLKSKRSKT